MPRARKLQRERNYEQNGLACRFLYRRCIPEIAYFFLYHSRWGEAGHFLQKMVNCPHSTLRKSCSVALFTTDAKDQASPLSPAFFHCTIRCTIHTRSSPN